MADSRLCKVCGEGISWGESFCYHCRGEAEARATADRRWTAERALRSRIVRAQQVVDERQESHARERAKAKQAFENEVVWASYAAGAEEKLRNLQAELEALLAETQAHSDEQPTVMANRPDGPRNPDGNWLEDER